MKFTKLSKNPNPYLDCRPSRWFCERAQLCWFFLLEYMGQLCSKLNISILYDCLSSQYNYIIFFVPLDALCTSNFNNQ